jgi:predicted transcriptional regulator
MLKSMFLKNGDSQISSSEKRDKLEIQADILRSLLISPLIFTHILNKSNLCGSTGKYWLQSLSIRGLIEEFNVPNRINLNLDNRKYSHSFRKISSRKAYRITEKGKMWLEKFKSLNEL